MMRKFDIRRRRGGFTLIELLIVIGLLAALTALVLPALMADRETAIVGICDYNQAGTIRVLNQFQGITGMLPNGMHSGIQADQSTLMDLPPAFKENPTNFSSVSALTQNEADSLNTVGITKLAYGDGDISLTNLDDRLGYQPVASGLPVLCCTNQWIDDGGNPFSFDGKGIAVYEAEGYTKVAVLFIAPTTDWDAKSNNNRWVDGVSTGMELEGTCPIPDSEFAYYVAYVGLRSVGAYVSSYDVTPISGQTFTPGNSTERTAAITTQKTACEGQHTLSADYESYVWVTGSDSDGNETHTLHEHDDQGTLPDKVTNFVITVLDEASGKLLGTSCPECGITNP